VSALAMPVNTNRIAIVRKITDLLAVVSNFTTPFLSMETPKYNESLN
jgi:hypothetical protein